MINVVITYNDKQFILNIHDLQGGIINEKLFDKTGQFSI